MRGTGWIEGKVIGLLFRRIKGTVSFGRRGGILAGAVKVAPLFRAVVPIIQPPSALPGFLIQPPPAPSLAKEGSRAG